MRILHVTPSFYPAFSYGGPTTSTYELCRYLPLLGCEVRVLTTDANGLGHTLEVDSSEEVHFEEGFSVRYCHRLLRHSVSLTLLGLLQQYVAWADVVHLHYVYSFPTLPTHLQCRLFQKPLVWSPHGALSRWERSSRVVGKAIWDSVWYHESDLTRLLVQFTSDQEEKNALARFPRLRTVVVPMGVDVPNRVTPPKSAAEMRLLFLGRLDPIKGLENLLQACSLLKDGSGDWGLCIAGSGKSAYVNQVKQLITELGVATRVQMLGEVVGPGKKKLFENSDVAIVPSYTENFGIVVAEALAHGVPVIAGRGTPWSRLEEKGCGLWVNNDPQSLASAIRKMRSMPLQEMGIRGRQWMQNEFTWESVARKLMELYKRLAVKRAAGA